MLPITNLNFGSIDAINYKQRSEKDFLNRIFYRDAYLDSILKDKKYFIIGEKGTGKTAYAALLNNSDYHDTRCSLTNITETDYRKFVHLKSLEHYKISDYIDIWKCIFLLIVSDHLLKKEPSNILTTIKFGNLKKSIDKYYQNAFSPEVVYALNLVEDFGVAAKIFSENFEASGSHSKKQETQNQNFQTNLLFIRKKFEESIAALKLQRDHIVFMDGIDIRPIGISYADYIECIRGLALAAWSLNTEYFANIKDSKGRIKIVTLLRPDIFGSLGYQNPNAKVRDNAVYLDWRTTYKEYRTSRIFRLIDGILSKQQQNPEDYAETGIAWDSYFPYTVPNQLVTVQEDNPFIGFLRYSLYRPRDIISYLLILQEYVAVHQDNKLHFRDEGFRSCQARYSDYLLGEIRDQIDFYYSNANFEDLTMFFSYLGGRSYFNYHQFEEKYAKYQNVISKHESPIAELIDGPEKFLQFLYSLNIIGYREITDTGVFIHWCFRDRTPIKLNPKVRFGVDYNIHPGLARALSVGRRR